MLVILPAQDATPPAELRQTADRSSASVSAAHEVPPGATALRPLLEARGWRRLAALLEASGDEVDPWRGVWYAEHAQAQLAPGSLCCSEPAWVAWTCWRPQAAAREEGGQEEEGEEEEGEEEPGASWVVHVCAVDGSAARRALVALEVARGAALAVEVAAWPRAWWPQLERCAEEGGRQLSEGNAMAAVAAAAAEAEVAAEAAAEAAAAAVEDVERAAAGSESGSDLRGVCGLVVERGAAQRLGGGWVEDLPNAASPISPVASAGEVWARLAR